LTEITPVLLLAQMKPMNMDRRWVDGRSGWIGQLVGDIVLDHLDPSRSRVHRIKGTVFGDDQQIWVGRIVADESYLSPGVQHWANVSWDQLADAEREANDSKRQLFFLFITFFAERGQLVCWKIPSGVLAEELKQRSKDRRGEVYGLHISDKGGRHVLGSHDVTKDSFEVALKPEQLKRLRLAASPGGELDEPTAARAAGDLRERSRSQALVEPLVDLKTFSIPLSEGREAKLVAPVPVSEHDVARIKGWIDLMSDVLAGR
jgi:hypothetical protein